MPHRQQLWDADDDPPKPAEDDDNDVDEEELVALMERVEKEKVEAAKFQTGEHGAEAEATPAKPSLVKLVLKPPTAPSVAHPPRPSSAPQLPPSAAAAPPPAASPSSRPPPSPRSPQAVSSAQLLRVLDAVWQAECVETDPLNGLVWTRRRCELFDELPSREVRRQASMPCEAPWRAMV